MPAFRGIGIHVLYAVPVLLNWPKGSLDFYPPASTSPPGNPIENQIHLIIIEAWDTNNGFQIKLLFDREECRNI